MYAAPVGSELARQFTSAKIGIVWHTTYTGRSLDKMKASFGKGIANKMRKNRNVWVDDATYRDHSGTVSFTKQETAKITEILSNSGKLFQTIQASVMNKIADDETLNGRMKVYNNSMIRMGSQINFKSAVPGLIDSLETYFQKEVDKVKTEKSKQVKTELIYQLMGLLTEAKQMIIDKLNKGSSLKTMLRTAYGFKVTDEEGYVAIDKLNNGAVKLVNRVEFSRANFSPDIIKGWER